MSSLTKFVGLKLGSDAANLAPYHTMFHFVFAYAFLSTRGLKNYLKIDHNVSPREDTSKYGERAVAEGMITRRQLNLLKRNEGAHANSVENFPVFVASTLFATVAGVSNAQINGACTIYTAARIVFAVSYLAIERAKYSYVRSLAWWAGNLACLNLLWAAGKALDITA
ncbi:hypothetical protein LTR70_009517 [Exophiala xenobiotica]|uniref:Glutathione transferase n=1 Tax=Lithohypha guttulata TaxID=1690604 RepID=A0ABR0K0D2_9EURO|nr:hypothetical protein LTR24_008374 [Lithohypha guttulata]KAK5310374.1 hypothetical protein LTR70_009517 [Exophiala xenobiotica]